MHHDATTTLCSIDKCDKPVWYKAGLLCVAHYNRMRRHGDPLGGALSRAAPTEERFFSKVEFTDSCWLWVGSRNKGGYGAFGRASRGVSVQAHRWAYEYLREPIPTGLHIDHLCRVRACVNPWHMEPVTNAENVRRGLSGIPNRTACINGHVYKDGSYRMERGKRICVRCRRVWGREHARAKSRAGYVAKTVREVDAEEGYTG
jgi:hypothetical protein